MPFYFDRGRESMRRPEYDYSQPGFYFVTICTRERECLFGDVKDGKMTLNDIGQIVRDEWLNAPQIRKNVGLDEFVIMPNHLHGIIIIKYNLPITRRGVLPGRGVLQYAPTDTTDVSCNKERAALKSPSQTLGAIIRGFKGASTTKINAVSPERNRAPIWQRNFHDEIIHNRRQLFAVRNYIRSNPANWEKDTENKFNTINP